MRIFEIGKVGTAAIAILVLFAGCGEFQKALDSITTQDVEFFQGIYDGGPVREIVSLSLAKSVQVSVAGPVEVNEVTVETITENLHAVQAEIPDIVMGLSGAVSNSGGSAARLYVFFSPSDTPSQSEVVEIGSVVVEAGQNLQLKDSSDFDQSPDEVQANLKAYFDANPGAKTFHLLLWAENANQGSVVVHALSVESSPAFSWLNSIPSDLKIPSGVRVKDISTVNVDGTFENLGDVPARFVWVVGPGSRNLNVNNDLIIDITLDPGEKVDASQGLVVPGGLHMLKSYMKNLVNGDSVKGNLMVTSPGEVAVDIRVFKVLATARVGI